MRELKLKYHFNTGDVSYILPSPNKDISSFQCVDIEKCLVETEDKPTSTKLEETIFQLPHLKIIGQEVSFAIVEKLFESTCSGFFLQGTTTKKKYKNLVLSILDINTCTTCYKKYKSNFLNNSILKNEDNFDSMFTNTFLNALDLNKFEDKFLLIPIFADFTDNANDWISFFGNSVRRLETNNNKWICGIGVLGRMAGPKERISKRRQFSYRVTVYVSPALAGLALLDEYNYNQYDENLSKLKCLAQLVEKRIEGLCCSYNKEHPKQTKPILSSLKDSFAIELQYESTVSKDNIEFRRHFIPMKIAKSVEIINNFMKNMKKTPVKRFYVGLNIYRGLFPDVEELEKAADNCVNKALQKEYRKNTAQIEKSKAKGKTSRVKFFFNARYLWRKGEISAHDAEEEVNRETFGIRTDVDPVPPWIKNSVIKKLETSGIVENDFVNAVAMNVYLDGKLGLGQHYDDLNRFKPPIISLRLHSASRLSFGSGFGYQNSLFNVPLLVGDVLEMEVNSFSLVGVSHCIRDFDLCGKSTSLILRHIPIQILERANLIPEWSPSCFLNNGQQIMLKYRDFNNKRLSSWQLAHIVDIKAPTPVFRKLNRIYAGQTQGNCTVSCNNEEFACKLLETGTIITYDDNDLVEVPSEWVRKNFFLKHIKKSAKRKLKSVETEVFHLPVAVKSLPPLEFVPEFDICPLLGKKLIIYRQAPEEVESIGFITKYRYSSVNLSLSSPSKRRKVSDYNFKDSLTNLNFAYKFCMNNNVECVDFGSDDNVEVGKSPLKYKIVPGSAVESERLVFCDNGLFLLGNTLN